MTVFSETLLDILSELNNSSRDIQASAIISSEGLVMATLIDKNLDEDRVAAMTIAISAQANRVVREIKLGKLQQVLIRGQKGYALIISAGEQAVLPIMLNKSAQLGFIFLSCERSAKKLQQLVSLNLALDMVWFTLASEKNEHKQFALFILQFTLFRKRGLQARMWHGGDEDPASSLMRA